MSTIAGLAVDVPFADVRAADLGWSLSHRPRPGLAELQVHGPQATVTLRVLGASHQVVLERDGLRLLCETVACDLPGAAPLQAEADLLGYRMTSSVARHSRADLASRVAELARTLADRDDSLLVTFPGTPDAVTALSLVTGPGDGPTWETWHAYPQTGELVHTRTTTEVDLLIGGHP